MNIPRLIYFVLLLKDVCIKLRIPWQGYKISALILEDSIIGSKQDARQFLKQYKDHGTIARKSWLSLANQQIIMQAMEYDDETTTIQITFPWSVCIIDNNQWHSEG